MGFVENTGSVVKFIDGRLVDRGEGVAVADGPFPAPTQVDRPTIIGLARGRSTAGLACGTLLQDPANGLIYGQADGAGGAAPLLDGVATYGASEVERLAGVPGLTNLALLLSQTTYPRPFTLAQTGGIGDVTQAAATWTSLAASNNGSGFLRLSSAGVHGLSGAAVGRSIYLSFASGLTSGLYKISAVVNTTTLDFTQAYAAVTTPAIVAPNTQFDLWSATVPGGSVGPNGSIDIDAIIESTGSTSSKYLRVQLDGSTASEALINGAAEVMSQLRCRIAAQNSQAAQRCTLLKVSQNYAASGASLTKDLTTDRVLKLTAQLPTADEYLRVSNVRVAVTPGL